MRSKEPKLVCYNNGRRCDNPIVGREPETYIDTQWGKQKRGGALKCAEHGGLSNQCIIDAFVNYYEEYANTPQLVVMLNHKPNTDGFIYEKKGPLYYAQHMGVARYHFYEKPGAGFGGAIYVTPLTDGTIEEHKGPWSSSAGSMNANGFGPCIDVSLCYYDEDGVKTFTNGHTFYGGAITLKMAQQALEYCIQGVQLMWVGDTLVPIKLGKRGGVIGSPTLSGEVSELSGEQNAVIRA